MVNLNNQRVAVYAYLLLVLSLIFGLSFSVQGEKITGSFILDTVNGLNNLIGEINFLSFNLMLFGFLLSLAFSLFIIRHAQVKRKVVDHKNVKFFVWFAIVLLVVAFVGFGFGKDGITGAATSQFEYKTKFTEKQLEIVRKSKLYELGGGIQQYIEFINDAEQKKRTLIIQGQKSVEEAEKELREEEAKLLKPILSVLNKNAPSGADTTKTTMEGDIIVYYDEKGIILATYKPEDDKFLTQSLTKVKETDSDTEDRVTEPTSTPISDQVLSNLDISLEDDTYYIDLGDEEKVEADPIYDEEEEEDIIGFSYIGTDGKEYYVTLGGVYYIVEDNGIHTQISTPRITPTKTVQKTLQQLRSTDAYFGASLLLKFTLGKFADEAISDYCKEQYESSDPLGGNSPNYASNNPQPPLSPQASFPQTSNCVGTETTVTAQAQKSPLLGGFNYETSWTITACKENVQYTIILANSLQDRIAIANGAANKGTTRTESKRANFDTDFQLICIETSDASIGQDGVACFNVV